MAAAASVPKSRVGCCGPARLIGPESDWVGKIPWRRAWQPTPVSLPGETGGCRSLDRGAWRATVHRVAESRTRLTL